MTAVLGALLTGLLGLMPALAVTRRRRLMRQIRAEFELLETLPEGSEARRLVAEVLDHSAEELHTWATDVTPRRRQVGVVAVVFFVSYTIGSIALFFVFWANEASKTFGVPADDIRRPSLAICSVGLGVAAAVFLARHLDVREKRKKLERARP